MKPAACSSASGEPVKPDLARRAASTPACAVRPTCSGFVIVAKLATTPAASEVAMAMAFRVSSTVSRLSRAHAAAAAMAPQIAVGWKPRSCRWPGSISCSSAQTSYTRYVRCDRLAAADVERPAFGQNCRREHGTGMPIHGDIVVVEGMGSDAVDEGGVGCRQIAAGGDLRGALVLRGVGDSGGDEPHDRLAGAGNHDVDAVDHVDARAIAAPLRNWRLLQPMSRTWQCQTLAHVWKSLSQDSARFRWRTLTAPMHQT